MTETGRDVVERLRKANTNAAARSRIYSVVRREDLDALLAVVEAAQDVRANAFLLKETGVHRHLEIHRVLWDSFCDALYALHSQASDEGKA